MLLEINKFKPYLLVIPCLAYLAFIIFTGLGVGLLQSLGIFHIMGMTELTLDYYKAIFSSPVFWESLMFSLRISFWSSIIAVFFGVLVSLIILNLKDKGRKFIRIFRIPLSVPHIVVVLIMINLLGKTGFFSRLVYFFFPNFNTEFFSKLIFDQFGIGIILVYLWKEIPFIALTSHSVFANIDEKLSITAQNLGANYLQTVFYILLPLAMPTIFSSFIIIFAFSFGAYEVPMLIGPTLPKALPIQTFIEYTNPLLENRPYALAYSILNLIFCFLFLLLFFLAFKILTGLKKSLRN
ncbi:MAG: ABC transporter permease subunit [Treponemataceae bacterium]